MKNNLFIILSLIILLVISPTLSAAQEGQAWPELSSPISNPTETQGDTREDVPLEEDTPLQEEGSLISEGNGGLTLEQAIEIAERKHPDLAVVRAEIGQANARVVEAGLLPDPEFIGRMESAPFRGETLGQAEYIAGLSQSIPTGNRIAAQQRVEVLGREKKRIEFESTRLAVRVKVQRAFSEALYWDRAAAAWRDTCALDRRGVEVAEVRVTAGLAPPTETGQAKIELRRAELELEKAEAYRSQALQDLAAAMGDPNQSNPLLSANLDHVSLASPSLDSLLVKLRQSPLFAKTHAEVAVEQARSQQVIEGTKPDVDLEVSYRRIGEEENAADVGLRFPLIRSSRKQSLIQEAQSRVAASQARAQSLQNDLELGIRQSHTKLVRGINAANLLKGQVLTESAQLLRAAEDRYSAGDASMTDVLPVRRDAISLRLNYLDSLHEVMEAWADLLPYL